MPAYIVERTRCFNLSKESIYNTIIDFSTWPRWSSWFFTDPDAKIEFSSEHSSVGSWYTWDGKKVGSGRMEIIAINDDHSACVQQLEFLLPRKSVATVYWKLETVETNKTKVTWGVKGKVPFFLWFIAKQMDGIVGPNYEHGLDNLASMLDPNEPQFTITVQGYEILPETHFIGCNFHANGFTDIPQKLSKAFATLQAEAEKQQIERSGFSFSAYNVATAYNLATMNWKKGHVDGYVAFPIKKAVNIQSTSCFSGVRSSGRYYKTDLVGSWGFLKYAWRIAMMVPSKKELLTKQKEALEIYAQESDDDNDKVTHIYVPVKM